jgi:hypothetical protein
MKKTIYSTEQFVDCIELDCEIYYTRGKDDDGQPMAEIVKVVTNLEVYKQSNKVTKIEMQIPFLSDSLLFEEIAELANEDLMSQLQDSYTEE